jgi:hypothetical protein
MPGPSEPSHAPDQRALLNEANSLYERFAKPLESEHLGEFIAISRDGRILLGSSAHEVGRKAREAFGPANFVFQIGPRVVGKWR